MDLNVRDWLIIIGALLATAVLLDGYRRMRKDRHDTIRLSSRNRQDDDDLTNPELPSGTARVIAVRETPSLHVKRAQSTPPIPRQEPKLKVELALDDKDDADLSGGDKDGYDEDDFDDDDYQVDNYEAGSYEADNYEEPEDDILFTDPADEYRSKVVEEDDDDEEEIVAGWSSSKVVEDYDDKPLRARAEDMPEHVSAAPAEKATVSKDHKPQSEHQELLVINAMAPEGKPFKGNDLLQILMACDVRYGKMNIFHRYENSDGTGEIQFSVANLVEPGNFNLDEIDEFTSPGVVFFMHLPGPKDSIKAYEAMVETARCLVKNLEGELRDQTHSVATKQTLEHYKQRIRDFERRQLTLM
ncbi:MAG: cell division protein ZipA [Zhongshania sp.]|jgi:cell division protein ZipA|nr:cell division protein ZipA [Zhongshania sp.]